MFFLYLVCMYSTTTWADGEPGHCEGTWYQIHMTQTVDRSWRIWLYVWKKNDIKPGHENSVVVWSLPNLWSLLESLTKSLWSSCIVSASQSWRSSASSGTLMNMDLEQLELNALQSAEMMVDCRRRPPLCRPSPYSTALCRGNLQVFWLLQSPRT